MIAMAKPVRAWVRTVSDRYAECLRERRDASIDVARARAQHDGYVAALRGAGIDVRAIESDHASPDACFVEDTAVIFGQHALVTRPGAEPRRAETPRVREALAPHFEVHAMEAPACLDGGDVMRAGDRLFVGLSSRTNAAGVEALARAAAMEGLRVVPLEIRGGLHLKSACTVLREGTLIVDASLAPVDAFRAAGFTCVEADEPAGANVLAFGDVVIASASAPRTVARIRALGLEVRAIDLDEIHKGDGALTCLSLREPPPGAWCV